MTVRLEKALDPAVYGGKAAALGRAVLAGLPVPPGFALSPEAVERVIGGDSAPLTGLLGTLGGVVAVRSSAIGEDGEAASFAGQHATHLNVRSEAGLVGAVVAVHASSRTDAALQYRQKLGLDAAPRMAIVIQRLVLADRAGVMFTRHPVSGADERVIEGSYGLGEAVVAGLVTPDHYRVARGGAVLERTLGEKDIAIRWDASDGTVEVEVSDELRERHCLDDGDLGALDRLASACERHFDGAHDIEWAFVERELFLLQRRAITRG